MVLTPLGGICSQLYVQPESTLPASVLGQVARRVSMQSAEIRAEFAHIVLTRMSLSYLAEILLAQEQMLVAADGNLLRWIGAVDHYAARLQMLAQSPGSDVQLVFWPGERDEFMLSINGELIMVSSIRGALQLDLERHIVEQFCERRRCVGAAAGSVAPRASGWRHVVAPVWHLSGDGPSCRDGGGLVLNFSDMSQMQAKRKACQQVISELETLAAELARQRQRGVRIDWSKVRVLPTLGERGYPVQLNAVGDLLWLDLPALASVPRLFPHVAPWLAGRANGIQVSVVIADAEAAVAPLLTR